MELSVFNLKNIHNIEFNMFSLFMCGFCLGTPPSFYRSIGVSKLPLGVSVYEITAGVHTVYIYIYTVYIRYIYGIYIYI